MICSRWALALGMFLAIAAVCTAAARADDKGYVLTQRGENFGDQYVYITPNNLLLKNPKVGSGLISRGPNWDITVCNEKVRIYYQATMQQYKQDAATRGLGVTSALYGYTWDRVSDHENIGGLICTKYKMSGFNTIQRNKRAPMSITDGEYWVANDIPVAPAVGQLLDGMYGLPPTQRYPIRLTAVERGILKTLIDTYRVEQAVIPDSYFAIPTGLYPVISYSELYMSDQQIIADMEKKYRLGINADGTASATINVGGINWNRAKLRQIIDALKNAK